MALVLFNQNLHRQCWMHQISGNIFQIASISQSCLIKRLYQFMMFIQIQILEAMTNSGEIKKHRILNEGIEFSFFYDPVEKLLLINTRNLTTEERAQNKFTFNLLPNPFKVLFQDISELFACLLNLPAKNIGFKSQQNSHWIAIKFQVLEKEKIFSLPVHYVEDSNRIIKEYQDKIEKVCQENRRLTIELRSAEERIQWLERELRFSKIRSDDLQEQVQIMEIKMKKKSLSQSPTYEQVLIPSKNSYKLTQDSSEYHSTLKIMESEVYKFVPNTAVNSIYFRFEDGKIIVKEQFKNFHQMVGVEPLRINQRNLVRIRLTKSEKSNIYFGFLKQSRRFQKYTCQHQDAISYKLTGGKFLFEDGKQSGEQISKIRVGDVLCLIVDPIKAQVTWFVEKVFMFKRYLPDNFKNAPLYPFVSLHDMGDEVEFI